MEQFTRIGMDTSKNCFQIHAERAEGGATFRKKIRRQDLVAFFSGIAATRIALEACGASHYWGRELQRLGHEVLLVPAQYVKPFVKRNKNDAADAQAVFEAMCRPDMTFVAIKSQEQQAALMLAGQRERLTNLRTQIANSIRGHAAEFGFIAAKGLDKIEDLLIEIQDDGALPKLAKEMFDVLANDYAYAERQLKAVDRQLMAWHRANAASRRLAKIPGIGRIGASLLVMKVPDPKAFKSPRHFASWNGLTPRDHSTAGKQRFGGITRAGDEMLRSVLVAGATSMLKVAARHPERASPWFKELLKRKPPKLAAIALANKNARIALKMLITGEEFNPHRTLCLPTRQAA